MAALRDLESNLALRESIRPAVHSATVTGEPVDMTGFHSAAVAVTVGAIAGGGDMTIKLQESDEASSGYTDVAAADLQGSFPATLLTNTAFLVGYLGSKRYLRAVGTLNGGTSVAFSAAILLGHPSIVPQ